MDVVLMNLLREPYNAEVKRSLGKARDKGIDLFRRHHSLTQTGWNKRCGLVLKRRNPYEHIPGSIGD